MLFPKPPADMAILRARSGIFSFWAFVILAVLLVGESALRGRFDIVGSVAPWAGLVLWAVYVLAYNPAIAYDSSGVVITNILRTSRFSWAAVSDITDRYQFVFRLHGGSAVKAWGGPASGRPRGPRRFGRSQPLDFSKPTPLQDMEKAWEHGRGRSKDGSVVTEWNVGLLAIGGILLLWAVISLFL